MSKTSKVVVWVVIIIIVAGVIVWFALPRKSVAPGGQAYPASVPQTLPTSQNVPAANAPGGLATAPTDNSNAALNQDIATVNSQLGGLASDSASIDQGLNDQPVAQGQ